MSKYSEIGDRYPRDRGDYGENATAVLKEYEEYGHQLRGETFADAETKIAVREEWSEIADAVRVITNAVNGGSAKKVAKAMYVGLCAHHRSLQNKAVAAMFEFLRIYKDTAYDLRNWSAVVAAAQVSQLADDESIVFPTI